MSYGLAYGLSAYGLAAQLKISTEEAKGQMDAYFARFGGVRDYLQTSSTRPARTATPRRCSAAGVPARPGQRATASVREAAERAALNAPDPGHRRRHHQGGDDQRGQGVTEPELKSRMLLQVHDELLLEVADGEREAGRGAGARQDGRRLPARVPLEVSVGSGRSWDAAAH